MPASAHDHYSMTNGCDPVLDDVIEEIANRIQAGEPVDGAAILARYPDRADSIRRLLPAVEVMAEFGISASRLAAAGVSPELSPITAELGTLGDFRLVREPVVGHGLVAARASSVRSAIDPGDGVLDGGQFVEGALRSGLESAQHSIALARQAVTVIRRETAERLGQRDDFVDLAVRRIEKRV